MKVVNTNHSEWWLIYKLNDWEIVVWFLAGARDFCLFQNTHTSSGAHTASHLMRTRCSFSAGKMARTWSWPLNIYSRDVWKCEALSSLSIYPHGMHTDTFTFIFRSSSSSSCSGRIRFDSCSLYPQNENGPSISSSVVLCVFVLLVYIVVLV